MLGWPMKFREIFHFVFQEIFIVISQNFISQNERNLAKIRKIFATKFSYVLDEAKNLGRSW
jgi:hypothetical protein